MKNTLRIVFLALCALAPVREVSAAFLIRDGKLQTDLNANTNRITNATDYVTVGGISLTNAYALAAAGGGSGATNFIFNAVTNSAGYLLFTGYTATTRTAYFDIGTNSGTSIDTNAVISLINASTNTSARLASNVWASADSTTNYVRRTGDTMTGSLTVQTNFFGISKTFSDTFQTAIEQRNNGLFFGAGRSDGGNSAGMTIQQRGAGGGAVGVGYSSYGQMYGAHMWLSGLESLDTTVGFSGDFAQINFTAQDGTTSTPFSIRGNWTGGSMATVRVSKIEGDGSLLTNLTAYSAGDIRLYGATTNSDATAAIASALAINNSIFIPPGTWTASNIVIAGTKTIYGVGYESRLSMAGSATGALINAAASGATVRVLGLSLAGGSEISRATNTAAGSRHGVQYATQDNLGSRFDQMWISGFTGYGIYGNEATYTGNLNDALRISGVTVSNCFGGVVTAGRSELVSVTDCFAGYNAIGFRAGAGNTQIKGCTAANNGIDYDVTATGANDAHGIINDCKAISVPARYTVRVSTNTLGFVFSGNSFYHGGILLESSKGALFVGNQISAPFVADRGGGGGTNFFINNVFGTGDANTLSNFAGTIYHVGNFDINGNRMWSETEPLYSLPSTVATTLQLSGLSGTLANGQLALTNSGSGGATNAWTLTTPSTTNQPLQVNFIAGANMSVTSTVAGSTANVYFASSGTGGTAVGSSIVAAWAVNVYQAPISTQAAYIKINFTNEEYDLGNVYNPTNFNLTLPTGWVSMAISRVVASQNARMIIPLYKNGSEMLAAYGTARFFDDVDGAAGSSGGSTHPLQFFNDSATNIFSVYCWWNTATRTNAAFRWSGTVQN